MIYLVPTPIGNLEDMTLRAIRILKEVEYILAEDTRVSGKLLSHYEIKSKLVSFHSNNEHKMLSKVVAELKAGMDIALISDAGSPGVSDPGFLLVRECLENDIEVNSLPGATALIPALVNSGFPTDRFVFEGFLPHKKGRITRLENILEEKRTVIFYESPHRFLKFLEQFQEILGEERLLSVSRELTKKFEETIRGNVVEIINYFAGKSIKGEFVICVKGVEK